MSDLEFNEMCLKTSESRLCRLLLEKLKLEEEILMCKKWIEYKKKRLKQKAKNLKSKKVKK